MNRQSNRIKANRKPASTENQSSRGVDKENKPEQEGDGKLTHPTGAGHPEQSATDQAGIPTGVVAPDPRAATEIETTEFLAAQGWKRLTLTLGCEFEGEEERSEEILEDPFGRLWHQLEWNLKHDATVTRAERQRITRAQACAIITKNSIPEAFQADFQQCTVAPEPPDLETAIMKARAFMMLMADSECCHLHGDFVGSRGGAFQAGINSLAIEIGDELAAGFYTMA
jgi:hypothetical protein